MNVARSVRQAEQGYKSVTVLDLDAAKGLCDAGAHLQIRPAGIGSGRGPAALEA